MLYLIPMSVAYIYIIDAGSNGFFVFNLVNIFVFHIIVLFTFHCVTFREFELNFTLEYVLSTHIDIRVVLSVGLCGLRINDVVL